MLIVTFDDDRFEEDMSINCCECKRVTRRFDTMFSYEESFQEFYLCRPCFFKEFDKLKAEFLAAELNTTK